MESHVAEGVEISEADIDRIEKAIRAGKSRSEVFPRLGTLDTQISGSGATVTVRFTKKEGEGTPVRYIAADDPTEAAAVREVDLQKRFYMSATQLAKAIKLTPPKSHALRQKLRIDADPQCMHIFHVRKVEALHVLEQCPGSDARSVGCREQDSHRARRIISSFNGSGGARAVVFAQKHRSVERVPRVLAFAL
jgi:hypothetical protein